jgi:hypothetical protein
MGAVVAVLFFGFLAWAAYQRNFGRWKRNRTFDRHRQGEPSMDAFTQGREAKPCLAEGRANADPGNSGG